MNNSTDDMEDNHLYLGAQSTVEPIVGALDLGSNSFHALVVRVKRDRTFEELYSEKVMLRLGEEVARTGGLSSTTIERSVEAVANLVRAASLVKCSIFVANATAAFREAENSSELIDAIRDRCGVKVHVISGHRESELIFRAVRASVHFGKAPALVADLGGGSLEFAMGDQAQMYFGVSLRLGVGRLMSRFPSSDPLTVDEISKVEEYLSTHLEPVLSKASDYSPGKLVVSSGTFSSLARISYLNLDGITTSVVGKDINGLSLPPKNLDNLEEIILRNSATKRLKVPGVDAKRNDQLPVGYLVLRSILRYLKVEEIQVSQWALREGMILDYVDTMADFEFTHDEESLRIGSVLTFLGKFGGFNSHARQVRKIVRELALGLKDEIGLDASDVEILEFAAMVHDVGNFISATHHDRHSAYLVEAADLRGFTFDEQHLMAVLCRYHKKGQPKAEDYPILSTLSARSLEKLTPMLALLRVGDALDRSHQGIVESCSVTLKDATFELSLSVTGDATLELYGIRRKGWLLEEVLSRTLEIRVL